VAGTRCEVAIILSGPCRFSARRLTKASMDPRTGVLLCLPEMNPRALANRAPMIGLDTNVLVRYFAQDDAIQSPQATQIIERQLMGSADRAHPICPFRLPSSGCLPGQAFPSGCLRPPLPVASSTAELRNCAYAPAETGPGTRGHRLRLTPRSGALMADPMFPHGLRRGLLSCALRAC
jgi:hypothetical protein